MNTTNGTRIWQFAVMIVAFLGGTDQLTGQTTITANEMEQHVRFLASDKLEGRGTGSAGADEAADYIAKEFQSYGLRPVIEGGRYFQDFEFVAGVKLERGNSAVVRSNAGQHSLTLDKDFRPMGFSASASFSGGVVFAGYGISLPDKGYDDYAGVDVTGKAVILLLYHPEGDNPHSEFVSVSGLRYKAAKAKEKGAGAIIVVTGPEDSDRDALPPLSYDQSVGNAGIPAIAMTREAVNRFLGGTGLGDLQKAINGGKKPRSFVLEGTSVDLTLSLSEVRKNGRNVVGYLQGSDPVLKNEIVVVGAHYDHLGMGGQGSGSLSPDTVAIHNGADDNASGTAGLLELAEFFGARRDDLKRSMLFIAFSGEERGLLGSAHYVKNPLLPLDQTSVMVNMDMIGRLRERKLIVYGTGTAPGFDSLLTRLNSDSTFDLKLVPDGFGPSDQSSFYGAKIPVFHFFTDLHSDYHKPSDDWQTLKYDGMQNVVNYIAAVVTELNEQKGRPMYVSVETPRRPAGGSGRGVRSYTGTIPDFGEQVKGMRLSGVTEGSPAAKAGLQAGDIIIKFGTIDINNLYDYTYALGEYKPGDEVEVVVRRGEETRTFRLTIERRNR